MKAKLGLLFLSVFLYSLSYSQEQTIKLQLKKGFEYVFEKVDKIYVKQESQLERQLIKNTKEIKITVDEIVPYKSISFSFQFLKNIREGESEGGLVDCTDYFFPELIGTDGHPSISVEGLFSRSTFKFSLNLDKNRITLINREELINSFVTRLREQEYDEGSIKSLLNTIETKRWFIDEELVNFITWFNNSELTNTNAIVNSEIPERLEVVEKSKKFVSLGDTDFDKISPGKTLKKYWIDLESGIITNYSSIRIDSIKTRTDKIMYGGELKVSEKELRIKYSRRVSEKKLFISGKVENPLSRKIYIRYLDDPFGTELRSRTVYLNDENEFSTTFDFSEAGLIYIENENPNRNSSNERIVMYGEPGDSLLFVAEGEDRSWELSFLGDRVNEAHLILELRKRIKLGGSSEYANRVGNFIFDHDLDFGTGITVTPDGTTELSLSEDYNIDFFGALDQVNEISTQFKDGLTDESYTFITNEFKAFFYNGIFNFLLGVRYLQTTRRYVNGNLFEFSKSEIKKIQIISEKAGKINIYSFYNDYGLQSRKYINSYLTYQFQKTRNTNNQSTVILPSYQRFTNVDLLVQFSQLVLTGAPFYREIGSNLYKISTDFSNIVPRHTYNSFQKETAIQYLKLMAQSCNDSAVINKIDLLLNQHTKLKFGNYFPDLKLVDINQKELSFSNITNGKPTIFYFPDSWIGNRYELDVIAPKNPDIKIVMVTEGSNFREWKEYNERAEPVITQLFFKNDSILLRELMMQQNVYAVFDKKGNFLDYYDSYKSAADKARESLVQTKGFNTVYLSLIILVLGIVLTVFFLGMLIWRWRVRQKFRKEKQQRRLRELELTAIRSQMNPHFLFNSLNSVQNLIQLNKGREAHLYLADFAGLIRKVLQNSEKEEVSLAEELGMTEQYLNLEKLRFDFEFSISVPDNVDTNNTMVPSLLLQPFTENAVIHGLQNKSENRNLKIEVSREPDGIKIVIEDNGIGREEAKKIAGTKNGKGSKLMRERLEILQEKQGEKYNLEIIDFIGEETGTRVEILIPDEK